MRLLIVNRESRLLGGIEGYLSNLLPALRASGHELALIHENEGPGELNSLVSHSWSLTDRNWEEKAHSWSPTMVHCHGVSSPRYLVRLFPLAPSLYFAHDYRATCISGLKTWQSQGHACSRPLGRGCLAHFFPKRCGGLNPLTMLHDYQNAWSQLQAIRSFSRIVTFSGHLTREYLNHGFPRGQIVHLKPFVMQAARSSTSFLPRNDHVRLLFLGRMDHLKGGGLLLESLPAIQHQLDRPLLLTFAGDGPCRKQWMDQARQITSPLITIQFIGWVNPLEREKLFLETDLLVMPGIWPEPFGLVGLEAAAFGVPAAAFDVGGISEWLDEGVNGHLASSNPPSPSHFAEAVARCCASRAYLHQLRAGAFQTARKFTLEHHINALEQLFSDLVPG
ncbi:MAG: glycosyltransferase family 4 protein [Verrucomicrobiota bacterium]|nr:glycosyltransferase family 4 protein [Verrucomicrobiota bacterium]